MLSLLHYDLEKVQRSLAGLAGRVEEQVLAAVRAIETRDADLAGRVRNGDDVIDRLEVEIEEECIRILERHHPAGSDLRLLIAVLKINHDLEQIADLAVNTSDRARFLAQHEPVAFPFPLERMAQRASSMLRGSLDALVAKNAEQALAVCAADDEVDAIHRQAYLEVEQRARQNANQVDRLIHHLSVARNLERIGDLASNIARDVVYMVEGHIVRHRLVQARPAQRPA